MIKLASLISELTDQQKELKKDYLFKQSKLKSSNTFPTWTEIWNNFKKTDGFTRAFEELRDYPEDTTIPFDEKEALEEIEDVQRRRYLRLVKEYKQLNGKPCWRTIIIPQTINPRKLSQLGIYWATERDAAEAHWGKNVGKQSFECTYQAKIDFHAVDWPGTMFSRMDYVLGDDEKEIRFLKNSKLFIASVEVFDNVKDQTFNYDINQERRL